MPHRRRKTSRHQKISRVTRTTRKESRRQWIGVLLVFVGALLVVFPSVYHSWTNRPATNQKASADFGPIHIDQKLLGARQKNPVPVRIIIPQVNIDLPVVEANVVGGYWETSETTASHGIGSANPGEKGNMVIFAHARDGLFAPLRSIKKYATIYVLTGNGWHQYRTRSIQEVLPQNTEVISPTPDETLTLFTCTGFLDSKRLVVVAQRV